MSGKSAIKKDNAAAAVTTDNTKLKIFITFKFLVCCILEGLLILSNSYFNDVPIANCYTNSYIKVMKNIQQKLIKLKIYIISNLIYVYHRFHLSKPDHLFLCSL